MSYRKPCGPAFHSLGMHERCAVHHDLPQESLAGLVSQFERELERFSLLWDSLEELDHKTWVLEPERPSWDCMQRRIVIGRYPKERVALELCFLCQWHCVCVCMHMQMGAPLSSCLLMHSALLPHLSANSLALTMVRPCAVLVCLSGKHSSPHSCPTIEGKVEFRSGCWVMVRWWCH